MSAATLRERVARALLHEGDGLRITAADIAIALCREEFAQVCLDHSFGRDIDWWLNVTKKEATAEAARECADAIRKHEVES
jgi:hypothetical protein